MSPRLSRRLRSAPLLEAVTTDRLVVAALVVALLEVVLRMVLAITVDPLAAVLWPPFVAVVGLAWTVPAVRQAMADGADSGTVGSIRTLGPSLAVVAVGGHGLAIAGGTGLFLLVDTPIRYALYWFGRGDLLSEVVVFLSPLFGVAVGTVVAWAVPAIAVVRVAGGASAVEGLRAALAATVTAPRAIGGLAGFQVPAVAVVIGATTVASGIGTTLGSGYQPSLLELVFVPLALVFEGTIDIGTIAFAGLAVVFGSAGWLACALALTVRADSALSSEWSHVNGADLRVPVARLVLVGLVLSALVGTAGVVRVGEVRPVDTAPDPLPDDPDELYATAYENTDRSSYEYRMYDRVDDDSDADSPIQVIRVDRTDRQYASVSAADRMGYGSMGTITPGPRRLSEPMLRSWDVDDDRFTDAGALPGYPRYTDDVTKYAALRDDADGWTVRERRDGELVLELTDPDDVFDAVYDAEVADNFDDPQVHDSWARMTVDTERGTLSHGEVRFNVTGGDAADPDRFEIHHVYEYAVDVDVERPPELGSPRPSEWLWKLFAY